MNVCSQGRWSGLRGIAGRLSHANSRRNARSRASRRKTCDVTGYQKTCDVTGYQGISHKFGAKLPYGEVLFLAVDAGLADTAAPQRPAGLGRRFASIHFDVATALARTSSGTAMPLSRAIASAKESCAALGALVPVAPVLAVLPAARAGACRSRNCRHTEADFV